MGRSLVVKEIVILTQGGKGERRIGDNKYQKGITEITGGRTPPILQQNDYFKFEFVHCSDAETAVNVDHFTGDTGREIGHRNAAEFSHLQ